MSTDSEVYSAATLSLEDVTVIGGELADVGRYRAHLVAVEDGMTKREKPFVKAIVEIDTPGDWQFSEFSLMFYVGVTKKKDKRGKMNTYAGGIMELVTACANAGTALTDAERKTIPTDPKKLANLLAKKIGRKTFDMVVYTEKYKATDDDGNEVEKIAKKGKIVKSVPPGTQGTTGIVIKDVPAAKVDTGSGARSRAEATAYANSPYPEDRLNPQNIADDYDEIPF